MSTSYIVILGETITDGASTTFQWSLNQILSHWGETKFMNIEHHDPLK